MIEKISDYFAKYLTRNSMIIQHDEVIYKFGVKVLFWHVSHILIVAILGAMMNKFCETLVFIILYSILRKYAGGYHAKSETKCLLCSLIVVIIVNVFSDFLLDKSKAFSTLLLLVSSAIIWKFAPVDNVNRQLSNKERNLYAAKTKISLIGFAILYVMLIILIPPYSMIIVTTLIIETFGVLLGLGYKSILISEVRT